MAFDKISMGDNGTTNVIDDDDDNNNTIIIIMEEVQVGLPFATLEEVTTVESTIMLLMNLNSSNSSSNKKTQQQIHDRISIILKLLVVPVESEVFG
jgi:hypothetical protein